ncbi:hypothetical protein AAG906_034167 [Vitis piasezkii]
MNEVTSCDTSNSVEEKSKIDAVKLNSKPSTSESSALESSKLASQSGGAPGGVVFAGGESKGEAELDVYTTWISAGDRVEVGDGRRHDGGAGRARLVRFPAVYGRRKEGDGRRLDCGAGRARFVRLLRRDRLHKLLAEEIENGGDGEEGTNWENMMVAGFSKMDEETKDEGSEEEDSSESSLLRWIGSTATVVVVDEEKLVVANCDHSRAVLCRSGVAVMCLLLDCFSSHENSQHRKTRYSIFL